MEQSQKITVGMRVRRINKPAGVEDIGTNGPIVPVGSEWTVASTALGRRSNCQLITLEGAGTYQFIADNFEPVEEPQNAELPLVRELSVAAWIHFGMLAAEVSVCGSLVDIGRAWIEPANEGAIIPLDTAALDGSGVVRGGRWHSYRAIIAQRAHDELSDLGYAGFFRAGSVDSL